MAYDFPRAIETSPQGVFQWNRTLPRVLIRLIAYLNQLINPYIYEPFDGCLRL
jgi:hypothetical protein